MVFISASVFPIAFHFRAFELEPEADFAGVLSNEVRPPALSAPHPSLNRNTIGLGRHTYRGIEVALSAHGYILPRFGALYGHHTKPHWNQVKERYGEQERKRERRGSLGTGPSEKGVCHSDPPLPDAMQM